MFGYVRPIRDRLSPEEWALYQGAYCGLCHALGAGYGPLARFTLNYDFTFLAILLSPPEEPELRPRRCLVHPFRPRRAADPLGALALAADTSMILTWHKLRDDILDRRGPGQVPSRSAALAIGRGYRRAAALHPALDGCTRENLDRLHRLEEERSPSIDRTADAFAAILRGAGGEAAEERQRRVLEELLYHLGRWIYLTDAWDDLEQDRRGGQYNPLLYRFPDGPEGHREEVGRTMTHSVRLCQSAAALADFGPWQGVVDNILYLGIPAVQELVLSGRGKELRRQKRRGDPPLHRENDT